MSSTSSHTEAVHFPLMQSLLPLQIFPVAQPPHVPPPQSVSVSAAFFTRSVQLGTAQWFVPSQTPLVQSPGMRHPFVSPHGEQEPPQSVSVSLPFLIASLQSGAWQMLPVQT